MDVSAHYEKSTLRERIVEHVFVGEALRTLWRYGVDDVELLRSEFDAHGYDLVLARGRVVRHIQFKTGTSKKPGPISVSLALADKPSGCVLWIRISRDLEMKPFFWFGGRPGDPLPSIKGYEQPRRPMRNKDGERRPRKNHRLVPSEQFRRLETIGEVLRVLFDDLPLGDPVS
jgi:hypothetical protein